MKDPMGRFLACVSALLAVLPPGRHRAGTRAVIRGVEVPGWAR